MTTGQRAPDVAGVAGEIWALSLSATAWLRMQTWLVTPFGLVMPVKTLSPKGR